MREYEAGIILTERRGPSYLRIDIECPEIARTAVPGQFVQVRVTEGSDPFLRRTFSLCGSDPGKGTVSLMIDVVGRGTVLLCGARRGHTLNLLGPLGAGFDLSAGAPGHWMLVAGGIGAAPLIFLAGRLAEARGKRVTFLMGARTKPHHAMLDGMLPERVPVIPATDDGSLGYHGPIGDLLDTLLPSNYPACARTRGDPTFAPDVIAACGPRPMMAAAARIAHERGIPCWVSLEERMACGIGACLGCAVRIADGRMARTCLDGPVFDAEELAW